jgi:hypothetical protein
MRCIHWIASFLIVLSLSSAFGLAETPTIPDTSSGRLRDPARLLPDRTDLLIHVPQPRKFVETMLALDTFQSIRDLAPFHELLDSTNARRFRQLVAYFEKELGVPWPQLLDRLAGRGAALGVKLGPNPAPALLVLEGDDEKLMRQFFQLALQIVGQELSRQEAEYKLIKGSYEGEETVRIGKEFHAAFVGGALFIGNSEKALHAGLDCLHRNKKSLVDVPSVVEARQLLPRQPLAAFWLNVETVRQSPQAKALYQAPPRDDPILTILFGKYLDLLGRSPFVCAALHREEKGLVASVLMPRGRDGMGADQLLHLAPLGKPGSRPLLEPKNVLYSESNYFDLANVWKERAKLFNEKQTAQFEKFDRQTAPFLVGAKLSKLLTQTGPYYRLVVAHRTKIDYKTTPKIIVPAFALVWELREPEAFDRSMSAILREAALFAGARADLKMVEEKYEGCSLVGYRFPENQPLKGDTNDLRFNFTPCFTRVGDQFVVSSTLGLCRELVALLHAEGTAPQRGDDITAQRRFYGAGAAAYLHTLEDLLITHTTLDQAIAPKEAHRQVVAFLDAIRQLGSLTLEPRLNDKTFRYDIRLHSVK